MKISEAIKAKSGVIAPYREIEFRFNAAKITNLLKEKSKIMINLTKKYTVMAKPLKNSTQRERCETCYHRHKMR